AVENAPPLRAGVLRPRAIHAAQAHRMPGRVHQLIALYSHARRPWRPQLWLRRGPLAGSKEEQSQQWVQKRLHMERPYGELRALRRNLDHTECGHSRLTSASR